MIYNYWKHNSIGATGTFAGLTSLASTTLIAGTEDAANAMNWEILHLKDQVLMVMKLY